jgi:peptide deformylase
MAILEIARLGNPVLRNKSRRVTLRELALPEFQGFLDDLAQTCDAGSGVGIAAPQVSVNKRVIIVHVDPKNPRYLGKIAFPLTIIINPRVISRSSKVLDDWEGDMSAGIRALVPRADACVVTGLDRFGHPVTFALNYDFHARVFQHEIDHLEGKFFLDRVKRKDTISELPEWERYWRPSVRTRS